MDNPNAGDQELATRLDGVLARYPALTPQMVGEVVRVVLHRADGAGLAQTLLSEVAELGRTIATTKAEIAALRVDDITGQHIPAATDELGAIVAHTATATDQILEVCETLDDVATGLDGETQTRLQDATTRIYEACSFQDITGQRISKVVAALQAIEAKVAHIVVAFGYPVAAPPPPPADPANPLLNGPQLPGAAMGQSDIDKLLADFD